MQSVVTGQAPITLERKITSGGKYIKTEDISSWFPLISFHTFSTTLSQIVPAHPLVTFSHTCTARSAMVGNLFFGMLRILYCQFNFLTSLVVFSGYIPSYAHNTALLVVVDHASIFLAAVICTVSSCFTNFVFPSHTSPGGGGATWSETFIKKRPKTPFFVCWART